MLSEADRRLSGHEPDDDSNSEDDSSSSSLESLSLAASDIPHPSLKKMMLTRENESSEFFMSNLVSLNLSDARSSQTKQNELLYRKLHNRYGISRLQFREARASLLVAFKDSLDELHMLCSWLYFLDLMCLAFCLAMVVTEALCGIIVESLGWFVLGIGRMITSTLAKFELLPSFGFHILILECAMACSYVAVFLVLVVSDAVALIQGSQGRTSKQFWCAAITLTCEAAILVLSVVVVGISVKGTKGQNNLCDLELSEVSESQRLIHIRRRQLPEAYNIKGLWASRRLVIVPYTLPYDRRAN